MSAEFKKAAEDSKKLKSTPDNDKLLELYSLFKVGNGEDFSKVDKPGVFDLKGKAKYNAWKKEVDAGTTADGAQQRYIALVDKLKSELGFSA